MNKTLSLREPFSLQIRAEAFNLFNRANFGGPNSNVFTNTTGVSSATFGRITTIITTSRQIQFGIKLLF